VDVLREWQVGEAWLAGRRLFGTLDGFVNALIACRLLTLTTYMATAMLLAWRRRDDPFVLFVATALLLLGNLFGSHFDVDLVRYPLWLVDGFPLIRALLPMATLISLILVFYLFPDGRFQPAWLGWFILPIATLSSAVFAKDYAIGRWLDQFLFGWLPEDLDWYDLFMLLLFVTIIVGFVAQMIRYRNQSSTEQRQQTKWILLG
jgi:hypothetical protein